MESLKVYREHNFNGSDRRSLAEESTKSHSSSEHCAAVLCVVYALNDIVEPSGIER